MKLSIVVPMYNSEHYIENCIESLLAQDISENEYEILIINDGSTDSSLNIVERYIKNNTNIRVITVENGGLSRARNLGIDNALGEYIFFVDSDDYIANNTLKNILEKTIKNKIDMMFFDLKIVYDEKNKISSHNIDNELNIISGIQYFEDNNVNNGAWHYLISRKFLNENNLRFVEGRFCEDGMFLISCIFEARRVSHCNVDVYRYVMRSNSITSKKSKDHLFKMIDDFIFAINYINGYCNKAIENKFSNKFIERLVSRRNSYIYFMQIRMIKAKVGSKYAKNILGRLKDIDCYKYSRMKKSEYPDFKTTVIWNLLNCKTIFCMLCNGK